MPRAVAVTGDLYAMPFEDGQFDVVVCTEVLEHTERPDDAVRELVRVADRALLLTVPHEPFFRAGNVARGRYVGRLGNTPGHLNNWGRRGFTRLIEPHVAERPLAVRLPLAGDRRRPAVRRWILPGLIVAGFALRLGGMWQSLYGDEIFTHDIVTGHGNPIDVLREVHDTSITPPLHYLLAWLSVQLGDPTWTVRLPSLILGTATIPLIYALAKRTVGDGLVAAGLYAIGPFALFYGTEARAYATLVFILTASTLVMLLAIDTGRTRWWVLFAVLTAAAMYTHYTALFVLAVQGAWALYTARRPALLALAGAVVLWLPWVPSYLHQKDNPGVEAIGALFPLTVKEFAKALVQLVDGHPFVKLGGLPGVVGVALLAIAIVIGATGLKRVRPQPRVWLIIGLAVATPVGVLLSQAAGQDIYAPRNLIGSLPYICVGLGALLEQRRVAIGFATAALVIGAVEFEQPANRRTPWREVARYIDSHAAPSDAVVQVDYFGTSDPFGRKPLLNARCRSRSTSRTARCSSCASTTPPPGSAPRAGAASSTPARPVCPASTSRRRRRSRARTSSSSNGTTGTASRPSRCSSIRCAEGRRRPARRAARRRACRARPAASPRPSRRAGRASAAARRRRSAARRAAAAGGGRSPRRRS